ncbi:HD domain-containing protein [Bacillus ginsengihumi]|uniref:bis(5'-nucleosyl)-tetraphosphatase (symmetrical) n=1 Tax=Heyndrickxia ginsengihumi TaxID=363870 RepID=A0A0A6VAF5_9BACI|nr:bis(5'-nucleosyl)-tetraphosphatase (symmetrical) YqeK [Heyndrickxia ginsengihumi]KHD85220.1 phosphohydrolase [Heyndrickxia ginsengihumi]NEY19729.1 HD domain-containing protein [Heyndrickxia ginsengihumi]
MERDKALQIVKEQLTERRYLHTIGVMETAIELAQNYNEDEKKAELAAIFHDYAKFRPADEMKQIIIEQNMDNRLLHYHVELWHAPVGAYLVKTEVGIKDEDILDAIKFHTSGRENMNKLEKIIYLADYIEPGRQFPGVDKARQLAKTDLDEAVLYAAKHTIEFLLSKDQSIFPDTFALYNDLIMKKEGKQL